MFYNYLIFNMVTLSLRILLKYCVSLGKPFTLIDNSYGKNLNLYKAWLSDIDTIKLES